ncbi:MAG: DNA polymerase I [Chlorobiaceae bacterium]|nr:DNA polymerase I [Chlorobiaceae bacterium]NTV61044.1 DNA polymerase I [Chlorobiaceae bacterium]
MNENQLAFFPPEEDGATAEERQTPQQKPDLFLLDGMALVYRAFFALQRAGMKNRAGMPTGAVYGFASALLKILETYRPHYLACAFDSREKTFRHDLFADYKANRPAPPEDLICQLETVFELLAAFDIPLIKYPGFEADDLIGTASRKFEQECTVYIVTPDKDLSQLVHDGTRILRPGKNQNELELLGRTEIEEIYGVGPELFTELLTLCGDTSDNIPGAKGIGPKTASALLHKFGSIDNIYRNLADVSPKVRQSLSDFLPKLELVRTLVQIRTDIDIDLPLEKLECGEPDSGRLMPLLEKLELRSIAARVRALYPGIQLQESEKAPEPAEGSALPDVQPDQPAREEIPADYTLVSTGEGLEKLIHSLESTKRFAIDTETTSLDTFKAELAGISISAVRGKACFLYFGEGALDTRKTLERLRPLLENPELPKSGQNLKYDILVLKKYGIDLGPVGFDTMLASYVSDPEQRHNLDDLAARHLGYRTTTFDELVGTGKQKIGIFEVDPLKLRDYACQDADIALRLEEVFREKFEGEEKLRWLCENIEFPLVSVLAAMEFEGISIDEEHLAKTSVTVEKHLELLKEKIYGSAGTLFNIDSPKQLAHILFEVLGLPAKKATKTGFSTNVEVLEELAPLHPVASDLLEYRSLQKLKTTYIDALPQMVNPLTGRVHTSFNQHVTATGRLSSSGPNLQNIPIRTTLGKEIRRAFIPSSPEKSLLSADYSQIELRIAAEISGDPKLIDAFRNREDIHAATAKVIFGTDEVTGDMRRKAKEVNFGVLYGIMPYGLSRRLNIPRSEADTIIRTYKSKYPGLFRSLQDIVETGRENGYVTTLLGRRRYLPDLNSRNAGIRNAAERAAMNTPIQGTAADIIKCAMNLCRERMNGLDMKSSMLLQVHDELLFETDEQEKLALEELVRKAMIDAAEICGLQNVPVEVDTGIGKNWLEAH